MPSGDRAVLGHDIQAQHAEPADLLRTIVQSNTDATVFNWLGLVR